MRNVLTLLAVGAALTLTGCAGPEQKLGRGLNNSLEFVRMGEIRRSVEQTALWDSPAEAHTTGLVRGFNRSLARTALGVYEIATFPLPPYHALFTPKGWPQYNLYPDPSIRTTTYPWGGLKLPADPVYPDSYKPGLISDSLFCTDTSLGFSGGDVAPMIPGSRFRIFDN